MSSDQNFSDSIEPLLKWLNKHFNIHRFLWLAAIVIFIVAWNRGLALLYGMLALILGVLCLSYVYPYIFLRDVTISRKQKTVVKAGESLKIQYNVKTSRSLLNIEICEALPFNFTSGYFSYFIPVVSGEYRFNAMMPCEQRGLFMLDDLSIQSSYPFGVFRHTKSLKTDAASVLVLPKTFPIRCLPFSFTGMHSKGGNIEATTTGLHNEYSGLREYRYGDSMKHIHWASSARHQELVVKEYESFDRPNILIVLDQHASSDIGDLPNSTFEYAIQITASIIEYAIVNNMDVHVFGKGKVETRFSVTPGSLNSREYLEKLALLKSDGDVTYDQALGHALSEFYDINTLITFTNRSADIYDSITTVTNTKLNHIDIEMIDESFILPLGEYQLHNALQRGNRVTWSVCRLSNLEELFVC